MAEGQEMAMKVALRSLPRELGMLTCRKLSSKLEVTSVSDSSISI